MNLPFICDKSDVQIDKLSPCFSGRCLGQHCFSTARWTVQENTSGSSCQLGACKQGPLLDGKNDRFSEFHDHTLQTCNVCPGCADSSRLDLLRKIMFDFYVLILPLVMLLEFAKEEGKSISHSLKAIFFGTLLHYSGDLNCKHLNNGKIGITNF